MNPMSFLKRTNYFSLRNLVFVPIFLAKINYCHLPTVFMKKWRKVSTKESKKMMIKYYCNDLLYSYIEPNHTSFSKSL